MSDTPKDGSGGESARFIEDTTAWATWLYYAESRTQAEVAKALGVSRASVANYLADARRRGLVTISLAPDLLEQADLSRKLATRFSLKGAFIAPEVSEEDSDPKSLRKRLGIAGAQILLSRLKKDMTLGVAWGRTMLELANALPESRQESLRVVQVSGSSLGDDASSPEACTLFIANRLGARCHNFHAPAVVTTPDLRTALLGEPSLKRHFERVHSCNTVVFGVGELNDETRWADGNNLIQPSAEEYMKSGAAGIVIGRFIDDRGHALEGPLTGLQIGMELHDLKAVPERICVAGGQEKLEALHACLTGGYVTDLVTDRTTAEHLLREDK
ncbi:sugar-binding transcriptional regulator [Roseibium porphyridii]|uniref:Sugar-binding transcriptional regulator n=1 Tax=Roseibium porphyridii TaxID=2866279 RepID=A0ABY8F527_9HYPH|nr:MULTISPECIES: sugar-binding transcriptional regulator [Stappiaceae]QFT29917.1 Transcriptional regulator LsrR [Labrenzia sp. THAF82]WFE90598.1 sugar-binding transcriptional regulator [Roseibium sp. KMA01]